MVKGNKTSADVDNDESSQGIIPEDVEWLTNIMNEFENTDKKSRVVFLSSKSRTYFPEDPGVSRFAIEYAMNCAPGDVPNPKYLPCESKLCAGGISNKGYRIGGLSGPRFAKDFLQNNPAPNAYQQWVAVPLPRKKIKIKKELPKKSMPGISLEEGRRASESDILQEMSTHLGSHAKMTQEELRNLCLQSFIGFGSHLAVTRFKKESKFQTVGVGSYDLTRKPGEIRKACSFGKDPVRLIPPAVTRCNYKGHDKCFECDELLRSDYYRTLKSIRNPFYNINPYDRVRAQDLDSIYLKEGNSIADHLNRKIVQLCLCRKCYCRAVRGDSKFWNAADMPRLFTKTRHCSYIHDHKNIPIFTHKTDCRFIRKLHRKEILMSKYYKDACERIIKNKY